MMDAELYQRINYEIMRLEQAEKEYVMRLDQLQGYRGAFLRWEAKGKEKYYYIKYSGSKSYKYVGKSNRPDVKKVKEVRFLEEAILRLDQDIGLLKSILDGFLSYDQSSVNESLPIGYRCEVPPVSKLYEIKGREWKTRRLEFQKGFAENYPQHKKHRTSDGVMVKTISELTLYERLKDSGLAIIYELPLPLKDYGPPIYPDITALSPIDMETEIIIEFVGRLDLPEYRDDFAKKLGRYLRNGYKLGINLFFIYNDSDGNIDSIQITKVIADIFGIR